VPVQVNGFLVLASFGISVACHMSNLMLMFNSSPEIVWTYARGKEQIRFRRAHDTDGLLLIESVRGRPDRSHFFVDLAALARFRDARVQRLEQEGWSLLEFSSEHRSGLERHRTRLALDRRRPIQPPGT
jgi:hypothetical protein